MDRDRTAILQDRILLTVLFLGMVSLYWTVVPRMARDWWEDPNFSHGILVPIFSAYVLWDRRSDLCPLEGRGSAAPGVFLVFAGLIMLIAGKAGGEYFTMRSSLVLVIGGLFLIVFGKEGFMKCLFPLGFLFFMVPLPYILYDAIAFPLKMIASWIGEHSLGLAGLPVFREGNIIFLSNVQLEVADACSGIRSLMSLAALAVAVAYMMGLGAVKGTALFLSAVPISVFINSLRIFVTGILSYKFGPGAAYGFFHEFSGWVIFIIGAISLFFLGIIFKKLDFLKNR